MKLETKDLLLIFAAAPPQCTTHKVPMVVGHIDHDRLTILFCCTQCNAGCSVAIIGPTDNRPGYSGTWGEQITVIDSSEAR